MRPDEAIVVKNAGSHFLLSRLPEWAPFPAVLRGKVRLDSSTATNPVAVGDRVRFIVSGGEVSSDPVRGSAAHPSQPGGWAPPSNVAEGGTPLGGHLPAGVATITEICERNNYIIRKSTNLSRQNHVIAANLDRAVLAVSLYFPEIKLPFLDRVLVTCEVYGVKPVIVLNKVDLYRNEAPEAVENFVNIYTKAGYKVIQTSCITGEGINELRELCSHGISLFSGESGVGKSSLIKALDPSLDPKIGRISLSHLQGKHTTSLYEMYPLGLRIPGEPSINPCYPRLSAGNPASSGALPTASGFIIDSPGLRGFGLVNLKKEEIGLYFPEMLRAGRGCRFTPCTHTHEPGCAVKEALEAGEISPERYNSYLGMLEDDGKFR